MNRPYTRCVFHTLGLGVFKTSCTLLFIVLLTCGCGGESRSSTAAVLQEDHSPSDTVADRVKPEDARSTGFTLIKPTPHSDDSDRVYIPQNLADAFVELQRMLDEEEVELFASLTEEEAAYRDHMGLGMWIRNNWGLWGGSWLQGWMVEQGFRHPDDMSGAIMQSFWRHLNDKPINLEEQVAGYQAYWLDKQKQTINPLDEASSLQDHFQQTPIEPIFAPIEIELPRVDNP